MGSKCEGVCVGVVCQGEKSVREVWVVCEGVAIRDSAVIASQQGVPVGFASKKCLRLLFPTVQFYRVVQEFKILKVVLVPFFLFEFLLNW